MSIYGDKEDLYSSRKKTGIKHYLAKEYDKAIVCFLKCLELNPTAKYQKDDAFFKSIYLNLSLCYIASKKYAQGLKCCEKILHGFDSKNVKAIFRRGQCRRGLKRFAGAMEDFKAVFDDPKYGTVAKKLYDEVRKESAFRDNVPFSKIKTGGGKNESIISTNSFLLTDSDFKRPRRFRKKKKNGDEEENEGEIEKEAGSKDECTGV